MGQARCGSSLEGTARAQRPDQRLVDRVAGFVAERPHALSVADDRGSALTRSELWVEAGSVADELAHHGLAPGQIVLVCLPNRVEWQVVFLACLRLGAVPATIPVTTDPESLVEVCGRVGVRALAAPATHRARPIGEEAVAAARSAGIALDVVQVDEHGSREWLAVHGKRSAAAAGPEGMHQLMFTSSTTGVPKAVVHTENTLAAVNRGFAERFSITGDRPIFMPSPLGHSVGSWHGARLSLFTGAALILQDHWDPERAIGTIAATGSEFTVAATPLLKDLLDAGRPAELGGLNTLLSGGAPVPRALLEQGLEQLPNTLVSALWGMSEGGVTTCLPGDPPERILETCGAGLPGLELRTLDSDGVPTRAGQAGELAMRGPGVFAGYLGQEGLYREQLTEDGFFRTGDLAELDEHGYLRITGRAKDLIVRGGVNISPAPLEEALAAHPHIRRVAVVGVPDERMGERICAVVVPNGEPPEFSGLLEWLGQRKVPRRLWPERLCVVDEMPQTAVGKIRKFELRDRIVKELV